VREAAWGRALHALVEEGMLDVNAVLAGAVEIEQASRSNHVGVVRLDDQPIFVLKRNHIAVDHVHPFAAEVAAYRWLASDRDRATLAPLLLAVVADDVMVLEHVADAQSFGDAFVASPADQTALLSNLGRQLGTLHSSPSDHECLSERRPWVLGLPRGVVPDIFASDPEIAAMVGDIGASPGLRAALEELESRWAPLVPCHGDVKFDNIVLGTVGRSRGERRMWLLDWEFAGLGLPAWDLAGVVDGLVVPALVSFDVTTALHQAACAQPVLDAYRATAGLELAPDWREILLATVARLAQSALQLCAMREEPTDSDVTSRLVLQGAMELSLELAA